MPHPIQNAGMSIRAKSGKRPETARNNAHGVVGCMIDWCKARVRLHQSVALQAHIRRGATPKGSVDTVLCIRIKGPHGLYQSVRINPVQGAVNGVRIPLSGLIQINRQSRQRRAQIMRDICPQIAGLVLSIYNIINLTQKQGKLT